jgi:hypothetical protein
MASPRPGSPRLRASRLGAYRRSSPARSPPSAPSPGRIGALGGRLGPLARFGDHTLTLATTEAA